MSRDQKVDSGNVPMPARDIDFATGDNQQPIADAAAPEGHIKGSGLIAAIRREFEMFLNPAIRKQQQKRTRYLEIIAKLESRQSRLQQKIATERECDADSVRHRHLSMKLKVVSKLISRAKEKVKAIPD